MIWASRKRIKMTFNYQWKWVRSEATCEQEEQAQHHSRECDDREGSRGWVQAALGGLLAIRPAASTQGSLDGHSAKPRCRRLVQPVQEGSPKQIQQRLPDEQLPRCLTTQCITCSFQNPSEEEPGRQPLAPREGSGEINSKPGLPDLCWVLPWRTQRTAEWSQSNSIQHKLAANTQESCET